MYTYPGARDSGAMEEFVRGGYKSAIKQAIPDRWRRDQPKAKAPVDPEAKHEPREIGNDDFGVRVFK